MGGSTARSRTSAKVRAVLAGGLVLGVGAAVTAATWSDSEYAAGTFSAGTFDLEGSLNGTSFTEHATSGSAAALAFTLPASSLSPGDVVYAPFAVRLAAGTTSAATVATAVSATTGTVSNITYELLEPSSFGCTSGTTGTTLVAAGTAVTGGAGAFALAVGSPTSNPGAAAYLCFKVTAGAGLVQGQSGTVTWQLTATSS